MTKLPPYSVLVDVSPTLSADPLQRFQDICNRYSGQTLTLHHLMWIATDLFNEFRRLRDMREPHPFGDASAHTMVARIIGHCSSRMPDDLRMQIADYIDRLNTNYIGDYHDKS